MTVFKNKFGTSLIEVMFSLALTSLILTPVLILGFSAMRSVLKSTHMATRLRFAKNMIAAVHQQMLTGQKELTVKKEKNPTTTLSYKRVKAEQHPVLKELSNLFFEYVTITWHAQNKALQESMVTLVYIPSYEKKQ